jgi:hypothetical protein
MRLKTKLQPPRSSRGDEAPTMFPSTRRCMLLLSLDQFAAPKGRCAIPSPRGPRIAKRSFHSGHLYCGGLGKPLGQAERPDQIGSEGGLYQRSSLFSPFSTPRLESALSQRFPPSTKRCCAIPSPRGRDRFGRGTYIVAGLGSHWARRNVPIRSGVRADFTSEAHFSRRSPRHVWSRRSHKDFRQAKNVATPFPLLGERARVRADFISEAHFSLS